MFEIAREFGHFQINKELNYDNLYVLTDNNYYVSKVIHLYIILNEKIKLGKFGARGVALRKILILYPFFSFWIENVMHFTRLRNDVSVAPHRLQQGFLTPLLLTCRQPQT